MGGAVSESKKSIVCFMTDFGWEDSYVGMMKGVILSSAPDAQLVDLTHGVPPQNIREGAYQLMTSYTHFPEGTYFLCVVDPGVGSQRRIILADAGKRTFIGPDNGLLSWVFAREKPDRVVDVSRGIGAKNIGATFHGRDIMAPVLGALLTGASAATLGSTLKEWVNLPFPAVTKSGSKWEGEILSVDRFGNLITNFPSADVAGFSSHAKVWFDLGEKTPTVRGLSPTYTSVDKGKPLAIAGSAGFVEIAVRDGSAAELTGLKEGSKISLSFLV
jgi:S-adenosylmethionine hydrolase